MVHQLHRCTADFDHKVIRCPHKFRRATIFEIRTSKIHATSHRRYTTSGSVVCGNIEGYTKGSRWLLESRDCAEAHSTSGCAYCESSGDNARTRVCQNPKAWKVSGVHQAVKHDVEVHRLAGLHELLHGSPHLHTPHHLFSGYLRKKDTDVQNM